METVASAIWKRTCIDWGDQVMSGIPVTQVLQWLGAVSVMMFLVSVLLVPWIILRLDPDFFLYYCGKQQRSAPRHPAIRMILFVLRNIVGILLVAAGGAMLVLPGQGILTLLTGVLLMEFPGKHLLLARAVSNTKIQKGLNWVRNKGGKSLFVFPAGRQDKECGHNDQ